MKHNIITIIILLIFLLIFRVFVSDYKNKYEVLEVISADRIVLDFNNNGIVDNNEIVCVENIESFELDFSESFFNKYSKSYQLSKTDMINLWYLGREFAQKNLLNKKVKIKVFSENSDCKSGAIIKDGVNYSDLLYYNGFGFRYDKVFNQEKFRQNVDNGRKLNLVILNHHSNKYHKLNCEYGNAAHDKVIIPLKQLPSGSRKCHFCYRTNEKKNVNKKNVNNITGTTPSLKLFSGNISIYRFDYTKQLKPDSLCRSDVCKLIKDSVNNAKSNIDIAIYGYDDVPAITSALNQAKARGVNIRFVYDESPDPTKTFYKGNDIIKNIANHSRSDKSTNEAAKLMHNKFIIFDNNKVITGSMNYSKSGLSGYDINDVIVINSSQIAQLYEAEFEQMLNGKFHNSKTKNNLPNKFTIGNSEIEIYFSPQDKSGARIIQIINSAQNYIYVPTFLITHKGITEALINAKKRNVDVKIIIDANSVNTRNTKHKILRENSIPLKAENYAGKLHSKSMIIDDKYIIVGSMNFSNSGENKNDENMLIIKNSYFAHNYRQFFLYLWTLIPDKYLKSSPRAESYDSIGSCQDGIDNNFDGKTDSEDLGCKLSPK